MSITGMLTVGTSDAAVTGNGTGTLILSGTAAQINATLAATNHVIYRSTPGFDGTDVLTVTTDDGGGSGTGGVLSDVDVVSINVSVARPVAAFGNGSGDDTYMVDNTNDQIVEAVNGGNDTVFASVNYTLPPNVENLFLLGNGNLQGIGNALANHITGNSGDNILDGLAGADVLSGGVGNDSYLVDNVGDQVIENPGEGKDVIYTTVDYTLSANVEILIALGTAGLQLNGNGLANSIFGNAGNNVIAGGGGNDTLDGGGGADVMSGGLGDDIYIVDNVNDQAVENSGEGIDTLYTSVNYTLSANVEVMVLQGVANLQVNGNAMANTIYGNGGNNIIDGGGGADILIGGAGDDVYIVDNVNDQVVEGEGIGQGNDTVFTSVNYTLQYSVETMVLLGVANLQVTGNSLANTIYGNAGKQHHKTAAAATIFSMAAAVPMSFQAARTMTATSSTMSWIR